MNTLCLIDLSPFLDFFWNVIELFVGAFLGAYCAFRYERKSKLEEERFERSKAIRDAQFAITARINSLLVTYSQYLKLQELNPHRWVELPPVLNIRNTVPIPLAELSFLLDAIEPNLLGELLTAADKYDTIFHLINSRNSAHDEFQRLYEKDQVSNRLQAQLTNFTDALYEQLPETITRLRSVHDKLGNVISKHYTGLTKLEFGKEAITLMESIQHAPPAGRGEAPRP
jgi:hypothetical protein